MQGASQFNVETFLHYRCLKRQIAEHDAGIKRYEALVADPRYTKEQREHFQCKLRGLRGDRANLRLKLECLQSRLHGQLAVSA